MFHGSDHNHCIGEKSTLAVARTLTKIGWNARCITHDTRNIDGHHLGSPLARMIQCYLLLQLKTISFLNGLLVNCLVSYAVNNYLVKSGEAYVPNHIVTRTLQVRQSIPCGGPCPNLFLWQSMSGHMDSHTLTSALESSRVVDSTSPGPAVNVAPPRPVRLILRGPVPCGRCSSALARAADPPSVFHVEPRPHSVTSRLRSCFLKSCEARGKHIWKDRTDARIFTVAKTYLPNFDHVLYLSGVLPVVECQSEKHTLARASSPRCGHSRRRHRPAWLSCCPTGCPTG